MKGRGVISAILGLAMMQLLLSSEQKGGPTAKRINAAFKYPAQLANEFINPNTPAIPLVGGAATPAITSATAITGGLSGTATPSGTGSTSIQV